MGFAADADASRDSCLSAEVSLGALHFVPRVFKTSPRCAGKDVDGFLFVMIRTQGCEMSADIIVVVWMEIKF